MKEILRIALIKPPLLGHIERGTGIYANNLYNVLSKKEGLEISLADYKDNLTSFDLIHYPYFDPFFLTMAFPQPKPFIITVHDLIPLKYPKHFPKGVKGTLKWYIQKTILKRADFIITDSNASKRDIVKFTGIKEDKISVIYLGVSEEFHKIDSPTSLNNYKSKLELPDNFILHVGDVNYNKNVKGLIKAFEYINNKFPEIYLVLIGNGFIKESQELNEIIDLITKLNLSKNIIRRNNLSSEDLVHVYNLAKLYIQPSFSEGFGLPVLEAMATGTAVISSSSDSLSEISADAVEKINPLDIEEMAEISIKLLQNPLRMKELITKGYQRVQDFNWEKTARLTKEIYEKVLTK